MDEMEFEKELIKKLKELRDWYYQNYPNGDFEKYGSSAICYCWYIWEKGFKGEPIIRWI